MSELELIRPTAEYAEDIMAFRDELLALDESFAGCNGLRKSQTCEEWLEYLQKMSSEVTCPPELVPSDTLIYVRNTDKRVLGIIDIRRHIKSAVLSCWGGHIGYTVRPSERKRGYAKLMLGEALRFCKKNRMVKVLITCNSDNGASERVILKNGGIFEREVLVDGRAIKRFWIQL